jgi:hypothetical protein
VGWIHLFSLALTTYKKTLSYRHITDGFVIFLSFSL